MHGRNGAGCTDVMVPARAQKVLRNHRAISGRGEKRTATRFTWSIKMSREHLARKHRHLSDKGKVGSELPGFSTQKSQFPSSFGSTYTQAST
jgi:hypothetical protein